MAAEKERTRLVHFKRNLLPLEDANGTENYLGQNLERVNRLRSQQVITKVHEGRYQLLDPVVFDIRDTKGMPRLMPFRLSNPEAGFVYQTMITAGGFRNQVNQVISTCNMYPSFPIHIEEHYLDVLTHVKKLAESRSGTFTLSSGVAQNRQTVNFQMLTKFGGFIPEEIKWEMVRAWTSRLFQSIFIVSEVRDWRENVVITSLQGDPLVVGYDGYQFWLIAVFNTTTLEEYVTNEFCEKVGN